MCEDHYKQIGFYNRLIININPAYQKVINTNASQQSNMTIDEFYSLNKVNSEFNEIHYLINNPQVLDFYQPYCKDNHIDDKHRLFFHYILYGQTDNHKYIRALSSLFIKLIELNLTLKSDQLITLINNNISQIFSSMRDPVQYNVYIERRNNLNSLEKLIPFLPSIDIKILPENII